MGKVNAVAALWVLVALAIGFWSGLNVRNFQAFQTAQGPVAPSPVEPASDVGSPRLAGSWKPQPPSMIVHKAIAAATGVVRRVDITNVLLYLDWSSSGMGELEYLLVTGQKASQI